ncbi:hypothetical protein GIB67_031791 [Kingdonia uniflora]|uniref:Uncharacterized protein n=1 Tax=Kingdonia uniflora TaxID=39325 RepID=A0A7J7L4L3_9MAGN|nr:hypothetical protein GIB67_031791 [Kingdonia uniflora]
MMIPGFLTHNSTRASMGVDICFGSNNCTQIYKPGKVRLTKWHMANGANTMNENIHGEYCKRS